MTIKPARTRIGCTVIDMQPQRYADHDPFPQLPFEHELMDPPKLLHVIWFCVGVLAVYIALIVLATRFFGWMP